MEQMLTYGRLVPFFTKCYLVGIPLEVKLMNKFNKMSLNTSYNTKGQKSHKTVKILLKNVYKSILKKD